VESSHFAIAVLVFGVGYSGQTNLRYLTFSLVAVVLILAHARWER